MNAYALHNYLQNLGAGIADIPSLLTTEAERILPELERATPIRSGKFAQSWTVRVGPDQMRVYIVAMPRDGRGRGYAGVVRWQGTTYTAGPGGRRLGGHWDKPPAYLDIARKPLQDLIDRTRIQIVNLTHPYVPVGAPERG